MQTSEAKRTNKYKDAIDISFRICISDCGRRKSHFDKGTSPPMEHPSLAFQVASFLLLLAPFFTPSRPQRPVPKVFP